MDSEWQASAIKRQRINNIISEIGSIIDHANLSYSNLSTVLSLHNESGCQKDCLDSFPLLQTYVTLAVELNLTLQELGVQVALGSPHCVHLQQRILARAYVRIERANCLFEQTLACINKFCSQPKKCEAKKRIYRYFHN